MRCKIFSLLFIKVFSINNEHFIYVIKIVVKIIMNIIYSLNPNWSQKFLIRGIQTFMIQ
jgi:hypothetical protein